MTRTHTLSLVLGTLLVAACGVEHSGRGQVPDGQPITLPEQPAEEEPADTIDLRLATDQDVHDGVDFWPCGRAWLERGAAGGDTLLALEWVAHDGRLFVDDASVEVAADGDVKYQGCLVDAIRGFSTSAPLDDGARVKTQYRIRFGCATREMLDTSEDAAGVELVRHPTFAAMGESGTEAIGCMMPRYYSGCCGCTDRALAGYCGCFSANCSCYVFGGTCYYGNCY